MSLRHALLALLRVGPMSGYELKKQFSLSVGHVWHAPDSQIYPELRKMAGEGLIEAEEQTRGQRGVRRLYHVTPAGERAFLDWINSSLDYQRVRDPAHLKAAYLESAEPSAARAFLGRHIEQWQRELEQWERELERIKSLQNPMLARRLAATDPADRERTIAYKLFTYEGLVARARTEIDWARRGLELVTHLEGPSIGKGAEPRGEGGAVSRPSKDTIMP